MPAPRLQDPQLAAVFGSSTFTMRLPTGSLPFLGVKISLIAKLAASGRMGAVSQGRKHSVGPFRPLLPAPLGQFRLPELGLKTKSGLHPSHTPARFLKGKGMWTPAEGGRGHCPVSRPLV